MIHISVNKKLRKTKYPKLMEHKDFDGCIVLFRTKNFGTVLNPGNSRYIFGSFSGWNEKDFVDFYGEIYLENGADTKNIKIS